MTQSWSSQSSFSSLQRVPSYDSFDSEDYPTALHGHKPKGTFKDYVRERSDLSKDKPVIPAAALAGYTGKMSRGHSLYIIILYRVLPRKVLQHFIDLFHSRHFMKCHSRRSKGQPITLIIALFHLGVPVSWPACTIAHKIMLGSACHQKTSSQVFFFIASKDPVC